MRTLDKRVFSTYYTPKNGTLGTYLNDIAKYKIMSDSETKIEIRKAKKGDEKAMANIVNCNQRFVFSLAKRFSKNNNDLLSDLINEANIGLIKSIKYFDEKEEKTFLTYAVYWMQKHIFLYLTFIDPMIKVSNKTKTSKVSGIRNKFYLLNGRNPTSEEIIEELSEKYNINIVDEGDLLPFSTTSIDNPSITENYDDFSSYYSVNESLNEDVDVISRNECELSSEKDYSKALIKNSMMTLSNREREVVDLLYGINEYKECKIPEVATKLGLTSEAVRQINKRALIKLKEEITEKKFNV